MKRQNGIHHFSEIPCKKKKLDGPIFFKNHSYADKLDYSENCKDIFDILVNNTHATYLTAQLIAEFGSEIYFTCRKCKKNRLFEKQLKRCHKCGRGQCEFCSSDGLAVRSTCGADRWFCRECSFMRCVYCQKPVEKRTWRNCCLDTDHLQDDDCMSLDDGSLMRCSDHCRKFRNFKKKKGRRRNSQSLNGKCKNANKVVSFTD